MITPTEDERNREDITQLCIANPPPQSKKSIPIEEFGRQFQLPWVLLNKSVLSNSTKPDYYPKAEDRFVYCRSCASTDKHNTLKAYKMVAEYQDDPLKNFACLIRLTCHNCGFEQLVPMAKHPSQYKNDDEYLDRQTKKLAQLGKYYSGDPVAYQKVVLTKLSRLGKYYSGDPVAYQKRVQKEYSQFMAQQARKKKP